MPCTFNLVRASCAVLILSFTLAPSVFAQCTPGWREGGSFASLNGQVYALAVWDSGAGPALYAGGEFTLAGSTTVNHVARWDGVSWHALGTGTDGDVRCFLDYGGELVVGGSFSTTGGVAADNLAAWNGAQWRSLGLQSEYPVCSLGEFRGELITGEEGSQIAYVRASNGNKWREIAFFLYGLPETAALSLVTFDDHLYVGGSFRSLNGFPADGSARWNGITWSVIESYDGGSVTAFGAQHAYRGDLYGGGYEYHGMGVFGPNFAVFQESDRPPFLFWQSLRNDLIVIRALEPVNGLLIAGGYAHFESSEALAGWDGAHWRFFDFGGGPRWVHAIAKFEGDLVVGGQFDEAGGIHSPYIARYACPPCLVDLDNDGFVTRIDFDLFVQAFETGDMRSDFDGDGFLTGIDFDLYVVAFEAAC